MQRKAKYNYIKISAVRKAVKEHAGNRKIQISEAFLQGLDYKVWAHCVSAVRKVGHFKRITTAELCLVLALLAGPAYADQAVVYEPAPNERIIESSTSTTTILMDGSGNVLEVQTNEK